MMDGGHGVFFGGGFMWLFWILIVAAVVFLFLSITKGGNNNTEIDRERPLEILQKRYARGEIEKEEYEQRRKELEG